jgi:hypothetical protein
MVCNIQKYWVSGLCPSSRILNTIYNTKSGIPDRIREFLRLEAVAEFG